MQRLFSTFPEGLPGAGLVLLRAAVAVPLIHLVIMRLVGGSPLALLELVAAGAALLVLVGLWTPIAGVLVAIVELSLAWSHPAQASTFVQLGTLGVALALLGPGGWSVDARLFGRKHIQIPERTTTNR